MNLMIKYNLNNIPICCDTPYKCVQLLTYCYPEIHLRAILEENPTNFRISVGPATEVRRVRGRADLPGPVHDA